MSKKTETAEVKKTEKELEKIIKAEVKKSDKEGFFRVLYTDGIKKSDPQVLRAFIRNGIAIFGNGNFSQIGNGHKWEIGEEIKPFKLRVKKSNIVRHESVHGYDSPVLAKVKELNPELY